MNAISMEQMEYLTGGSKTKDVVFGFCLVGSFLNPAVAGGCGVYALGDWAGWW